MNETVKEHCKHPDCKYRSTFDFQPCCIYVLVEYQVRGCDISCCDKYKPGKVKVASTLGGFIYCDETVQELL